MNVLTARGQQLQFYFYFCGEPFKGRKWWTAPLDTVALCRQNGTSITTPCTPARDSERMGDKKGAQELDKLVSWKATAPPKERLSVRVMIIRLLISFSFFAFRLISQKETMRNTICFAAGWQTQFVCTPASCASRVSKADVMYYFKACHHFCSPLFSFCRLD